MAARRPVFVPLVVWSAAGALAVAGGAGAAVALLIGLATLGNLALGGALILWSRRLGLGRAAVLYGVNLVIVLGLAGMARALEQNLAAQWVEQNVNLLGQVAFLMASASLVQTVTRLRAATALGVAGGDG